MTETQAQKQASKMSRETGKACKVIHIGNNNYRAVVIGSPEHVMSVKH